ncbi:hypothetical protein QYE76_055217 [Lolium multiflorum]|uniref:Uncharacterized protein n=1 Tax=Lolium multiflorum TaxID=4521 RepID=A0AAD8WNR6_LOLMU|nr:hypothetical protein QYE76_055217 [Lolium multiflorum]
MELKKRKEDMSLLTASIAGMSLRTRAVHNFYKGMILDDIEAKRAAAEAAEATPPLEQEPAPADTSATASASIPVSAASASASASAMEQAHQAEYDEFIVIDGPTSTQDAPSAFTDDRPGAQSGSTSDLVAAVSMKPVLSPFQRAAEVW